MNCVIVDDDEITRVSLANFIEKTEGVNMVESFSDPIEASNFLKENETIDLVFLDVEMPDMTGIEMLQYFKLPQVILISHNKEYAADAFDYNVTDFLSKPISYPRFLKALEKVKGVSTAVKTKEEKSNEIFIKDGTRYVKIDIDDILYFEAMADYIRIYTKDEKYTVMSTMKMMEQKMAKYNFIRIHRSHIINPAYIKEVEENSVYIEDKLLTVSRFYKQDFLEKLNML